MVVLESGGRCALYFSASPVRHKVPSNQRLTPEHIFPSSIVHFLSLLSPCLDYSCCNQLLYLAPDYRILHVVLQRTRLLLRLLQNLLHNGVAHDPLYPSSQPHRSTIGFHHVPQSRDPASLAAASPLRSPPPVACTAPSSPSVSAPRSPVCAYSPRPHPEPVHALSVIDTAHPFWLSPPAPPASPSCTPSSRTRYGSSADTP